MDLNSKYYKRTYRSTEGIIHELVNKTRGFIVNGDVDSVCNFLGNEWSFDNLGLQVCRPESGKVENVFACPGHCGPDITYITIGSI